MEAAGADVADLQGSILANAFFEVSVPLLDVLSGGMRVKRGEAESSGGKRSFAQDGSPEIKSGIEESRRRSEVVGLLRLREYIRDIVALIAPGVPVDGGKEDAIGAVKNKAVDLVSKADARSKIVLIRIEKSTGIIVLAADED